MKKYQQKDGIPISINVKNHYFKTWDRTFQEIHIFTNNLGLGHLIKEPYKLPYILRDVL